MCRTERNAADSVRHSRKSPGGHFLLSGIRGKARVGIFYSVSAVAVIPDWLHSRESPAGYFLHRRMV